MEKYGGVPAKKIETIEEYYSKIVGILNQHME